MNQLVLLVGFRVWSGSPVEMVTRLLCAITLFAVEMQFITWTGLATLRTLIPFNIAIASVLFFWRRRVGPFAADDSPRAVQPLRFYLPFAAVGLLVLFLNSTLPLEAADEYHLDRVQRILVTGTIAHDPDAHPKVNVLGFLYELSLADVGALPVIGERAMRFHGVIGLVVYALTTAALFQILGLRRPTAPSASWLMAVVPVVFHQFVMVKNDLFVAVPSVLAMAWLAARAPLGSRAEDAWAGWLTGLAVGAKVISFPLALLLGIHAVTRPRRLVAAAAAAAVGLVAAGLPFIAIENARVYGQVLAPFAAPGNSTQGVGDAIESIGRFAISLVDMGLLTRTIWPGRGGWGGTYGLPVIWALAVLVNARRNTLAARTLVLCVVYWMAFAAVYHDADLHRLALAPGLLAVAVAAVLADTDNAVPAWLRRLAYVAGALSAMQILRSAFLYLQRT